MKFGGSSVRDAERIKEVCAITLSAAQAGKVAIVSSAMKGVTDTLRAAANEAEQGDTGYTNRLSHLKQLHNETVDSLLGESDQAEATAQSISGLLEELP